MTDYLKRMRGILPDQVKYLLMAWFVKLCLIRYAPQYAQASTAINNKDGGLSY